MKLIMHFDSLSSLQINFKLEILAQAITLMRIYRTSIITLLHFCMDCGPFLTDIVPFRCILVYNFRRLWGIDLKFEILAHYLTKNLYNKYHYSAMHFA